ncbi:hypothetical protein ACVWYH_000002 [Bradyrhizobium sp. GM24.11]
MGRVLFTPKSEAAVDWSVIEVRFQDISALARSLDHAADLEIEPSATLVNDPDLAHDLSQTNDRPVSNLGGPLSMLSLLSEGAVSQLSHQDISEFRKAVEALASVPCQSATAFNRVQARSS